MALTETRESSTLNEAWGFVCDSGLSINGWNGLYGTRANRKFWYIGYSRKNHGTQMFKETEGNKVLHFMVVKIPKETTGIYMYLKNSGVRKYAKVPNWASLVAQMVKNPPAMQETWVWSLGWEDPWRKERLPTPVFLPREFPWTEEPGGLQFMGSQRVRHDWATLCNCKNFMIKFVEHLL